MDDVAIVVVTFNRAAELLGTLRRLRADAASVRRVIVVDNASSDGTAEAVRRVHPDVLVIRLAENVGAAARNVGVAAAGVPFVALCDDDTWWMPGALQAARHILACHRRVGVVCARVVVQPDGRTDPASREMAASPLPADDLPGKAILGFLAGASVVRREAFLQAGGFDARFFIGGEEELLALDLAAKGWRMLYVPDIVVEHAPSKLRDRPMRSRLLVRNALYTALLRLPWTDVAAALGRAVRDAARIGELGTTLADLRSALPWLLDGRAVVPDDVLRARRMVRLRAAHPSDGACVSGSRSPLGPAGRLRPRDSRGRS